MMMLRRVCLLQACRGSHWKAEKTLCDHMRYLNIEKYSTIADNSINREHQSNDNSVSKTDNFAKTRLNKRILHRRNIVEHDDSEAFKRTLDTLPDSDVFGNLTDSKILEEKSPMKFKKYERKFIPPSSHSVKRKTEQSEQTSESFDSDNVNKAIDRIKENHEQDLLEIEEGEDGYILDVRKESEDWTESFGTLDGNIVGQSSVDIEEARYSDDEGEEEEVHKPYMRLSEYGRRHPPRWYGKQMEGLIKDGKLMEALHMYEDTMLKKDRVKPNAFVFNVLIGGLGKVGYTKKAFGLFRKMRQFGIEAEDPVFTGLFNACANSPWPQDGLKRATNLLEAMKDHGHPPNAITYNAALKCFGKFGELQTTFRLVDEMLESKIVVDATTLLHLLIGCASDKEAGYKHAIEVWRRMRKRKMKPSLVHYNLLIRVMRDCGIGDHEYASQLLPIKQKLIPAEGENPSRIKGSHNTARQQLTENQNSTHSMNTEHSSNDHLELTPVSVSEIQEEVNVDDLEATEKVNQDYQNSVVPSMGGVQIQDLQKLPNLLNPRVRTDSSVTLGNVETASDRLALLGGLPGILGHMTKDNVTPDIKTFSMLLSVIPSNRQAENELLAAMDTYGIQKDTGFYNQMIHKRTQRRDHRGSRELARQMAREQILADKFTFGCLAKTCNTFRLADQLLDDMKSLGLKPENMVCGTLLFASNMDFSYKLRLLQRMKELDVKPNMLFLRFAEDAVKKAKIFIIRMEKGQDVPDFVRNPKFKQDFRTFMLYYKTWIMQTGLHKEEHPWAKYRSHTAETVQDKDTKQIES